MVSYGDKITFTNTVTDTDTVLTSEQVQDIVGAMFSGNTETRITATYQDGDGTIDLVVDDMNDDTPSGYNNSNWDTAYGWGNHASGGYLTSHQDISGKANLSGATFTGDIILSEGDNQELTSGDNSLVIKNTNYSTNGGLVIQSSTGAHCLQLYGETDLAYGFLDGAWGHWDLRKVMNGKLHMNNNDTYYIQTDGASYFASTITVNSQGNSSQWNTAYGWGNHASAGYTSNTGTTTASNSQTFTNKGGNISQWTNDSGYTTNTGDITGVTAGTGMSGGGTSGGVTLNCTIDSPSEVGLGNLSASGISLSGTFTATGDIIAYSDGRLKKNVNTIDSALDKVVKMRGVTYDRKDMELFGSGVIAQEIEKVAPELVNNDSKYKAVSYNGLNAYLVEAIKELKQEIEELKQNGN